MDWQALGDVHFRKWTICEMRWSMDLSHFSVCGACNGGPIAVRSVSHDNVKCSTVDVYTTYGSLICSHNMELQIVQVGWTDDERLLSVGKDGTVFISDILGKLARKFMLFESAHSFEKYIVEAHTWGSTVVALTNSLSVEACDDVDCTELRVYTIDTCLTLPKITSMAILRPSFTISGHVEVFIGTDDKSVIVIDHFRAEDQLLQDRIRSPIMKMTPAPNGRFLACWCAAGMLTVMSTSFTTKVLDFDTSTKSVPLQLVWCGEDAIILHWEYFLLLVGPYGHWLKLSYQAPLQLVPEPDCCRIITSTSCDLLQRVPAAIVSVRRIGSTNPAAMLYDAMEALEDGDTRADESLRTVAAPAQSDAAIRTNIEAATAELSPQQQKRFLLAAANGKRFCPHGSFESARFIAAARTLRVLNSVRQFDPGICLTAEQYSRLSANVLVYRLVIRQKYSFAFDFCEYLCIDFSRALIDWACNQVLVAKSRGLADEVVVSVLHRHMMLSQCALSLTTVAAAAERLGCRELSNSIIKLDALYEGSIRFLLCSEEYQLALDSSLISLEIDLIHLALFTSINDLVVTDGKCDGTQERSLRRFFDRSTIHDALETILYFLHHAVLSDRMLTQQLFDMLPKSHVHAGFGAISSSYASESAAGRRNGLAAALLHLAKSRDSVFQTKCIEDEKVLIDMQLDLENKYNVQCFFDLSVAETIFNLFALSGSFPARRSHLISDTVAFQRRFKITERQFALVKINALAASEQWEALNSCGLDKKHSASHVCVVRLHVQQRQSKSAVEAAIDRVPIPDDRFSLYRTHELWERAFAVAVKLKDRKQLLEIRRVCPDVWLQSRIDEYIAL